MNYTSAMMHGRNAMMAAQGETPPVAQHHRFRPAAGRQGRRADPGPRPARRRPWPTSGAPASPEAAGLAQTFFACWVEQQHENFQPKDIAYCRDGFYKNLKILNDAVVPVAPENVSSLQADAFFDFDKYASCKDQFKPELDKIADVMIADTSTQFLVWGFTDTVGTAEYNQKLSERRAEAVAAYLESKGVSRDRMTIKGFGMTNLAVETPGADAVSLATVASRSAAANRRLERFLKEGARPAGRALFFSRSDATGAAGEATGCRHRVGRPQASAVTWTVGRFRRSPPARPCSPAELRLWLTSAAQASRAGD